MTDPQTEAAQAAGQLTTLDGMSPEEVAQAHRDGRLKFLLSGEVPPAIPAEGQLSGEHTAVMSPEQLVEAFEAGRLDELLGRV